VAHLMADFWENKFNCFDLVGWLSIHTCVRSFLIFDPRICAKSIHLFERYIFSSSMKPTRAEMFQR